MAREGAEHVAHPHGSIDPKQVPVARTSTPLHTLSLPRCGLSDSVLTFFLDI